MKARTRVSVIDGSDCRAPLDLYRELRGRAGVDGAALMESAATGSPGGTRSLVVPEGIVRLTVRGGEARFRALSPRAERLMSELGEVRRFPTGASDPSLPDHERVRAASVLDAVRLLAGIVEDEDPGTALPAGVYGAFSYELVDQWEDLPARPHDPLDEPDINVVLALDTILYDHLSHEVRVVTRSLHASEDAEAEARHRSFVEAVRGSSSGPRLPANVVEKPAESDISERDFLASVHKFLHHIDEGDIFQGVVSRGLSMKSDACPLDVYGVLRKRNPSPYMFHIDLGEGVLLGASPETCVKVESGRLEIRPIAGTAPRGFREDGSIDEELDARLAVGLLLDPKEQAEHAMLVDLARNDVARVCLPGTRRVEEPFTIEKYSHVQHLVSRVTGEMPPELDALHAYRAAANMGTLTGAPKLRAMELIRETEPFARGYYGGAVGYLLQDGSFDSCIVIRSLRYRPNGVYQTRAGAGIVADSVPARELEETEHKARACREAVAIAETLR